ncbi:MAG: hypothetical protein AAF658_21335, partial [Myxococcota bacterium]
MREKRTKTALLGASFFLVAASACGRGGFESGGEPIGADPVETTDSGRAPVNGSGGSVGLPPGDAATPPACLSGGAGSIDDPIVLCTASDFRRIGDDTSAHYALGAHIVVGSAEPVGFYEWENPEAAVWFTGSLDGRGFALRDLRYDAAGELQATAMFAAMDGAAVRNLTVEGARIRGNRYVAVIGGYVRNSTFDNLVFRDVVAEPLPGFAEPAWRVSVLAGACYAEAAATLSFSNISIAATLAGADVTASLCGVARINDGSMMTIESV